MTRSRAIVLSGLAAGLLANYWVLEGPLAARADPTGSWISDLGARSEPTGWRFDLLDGVSGVLICVLAAMLWEPLASRSRALRWGLIALLAMGAGAVVDGYIPLSCAESLHNGCELRYDALDIVHATENVIAVGVTAAAFWLLGNGLREQPELRRVGLITLACGGVWLLLTILMGSKFLIPDMDDVKGLLQRSSQVVLGAWLILLALGVARPSAWGAKTSPGVGRIDGDGKAAESIRMP